MRKYIVIALAACVSGCSIHPQTENFARDMVPEIVRKVKCEARAAILATVRDPKSYLMNTGVGMLFTFDMQESGGIGSEGSFAVPLTNGAVSIGYKIGESKERQSIQKLKVIANYREIVASGDCGPEAQEADYVYPITGETGIGPVFRNYVSVMQATQSVRKKVEEFEDELIFTTAFDASVMPEISLKPLSKRDVTIKNQIGAGRSDVHSVKIVFTSVRSAYQDEVNDKLVKQALEEELKIVRTKNAVPLLVQVVDANKKIIEPVAGGGFGVGEDSQGPDTGTGQIAPLSSDKLILQQGTEFRARRPAPSPAYSPRRQTVDDILDETRRALDRSETRAFQDSFRKEFENR